nr:hypothetical protein RTCK_03063 [Rhizobium sp. TCK]
MSHTGPLVRILSRAVSQTLPSLPLGTALA